MISIGKDKATGKKEAAPSISQQNHARKAKENAAKKMSLEKAQRMKRAGLVK